MDSRIGRITAAGQLAAVAVLPPLGTGVLTRPLPVGRGPVGAGHRTAVDGARRFRCVIESLSTKVTMFSPKGEPLRAVCTLKLKEVKMLAKTDSAL